MINLLLMALFAVLFFIFFAYLKPSKGHTIWAILFILLFIGSVVFGILNEAYHYGMKKETVTEVKPLYSTVPKQNLLLYQPLNKKGDETIYMYRTSQKAKKPLTTKADIMVHNRYVKTKQSAKLVVKKEKYTYNNRLIRFFFHYPNKEAEMVRIDNIFYVPQNWKVLSVEEQKAAAKKMEALKKQTSKQELAKQK